MKLPCAMASMSSLAVTAGPQQVRDAREVRDRLDLGRGLLAAERAVEIAADADVPRVARNLADVVDVVDQPIERDARASRACSCRAPSRARSSRHRARRR